MCLDMTYEQDINSRREESLIPNTQIETMFMRICDDEEMKKYMELIEKGHISLATAYASNKVSKVFYMLVDQFDKYGITIDELKKRKKKTK